MVVFLRGAYDAANTIVPVSSDFYYQSRPTLAIARPNPADPNAALPLDRDWGLHPALKDTLYPLYKKGQVAFIPFAGTDDLSRSHFETQDTIELGQSIEGSRDYQSGFMSRLVGQLTDMRADRLHRPASAHLPRRRVDTQYGAQRGRQARQSTSARPS